MRVFCFCLAICLAKIYNSQSPFFGINATYNNNFYATALEYPRDGKFRVLMYEFPGYGNFPARILEFDKNRVLTDSIVFNDSIFFEQQAPLIEGNRYLFSVVIKNLQNPPLSSAGILVTDTAFNIISYHNVSGTNNFYPVVMGFVSYQSGYLASAVYIDGNKSYSRIFKLNKNFIKIDSSLTYDNKWFRIENDKLNRDRLFTFSYNGPQPCDMVPGTSAWNCVVFDTSLAIVNCFNFDSLAPDFVCNKISNLIRISQSARVVTISDTRLLLLGSNIMSCAIGKIYNDVIVNSFVKEKPLSKTILKTNHFLDSNSIYGSYAYCCGSFFAKRSQHVLTVATSGYTNNLQGFLNTAQKTNVFVNKFDTLGNVLWVKEYGGEMNYFGRSISFTSDGGCLIAGQRFDSLTMSNPLHLENFLLHLDSAGNILGTGIFEHGTISWNNCRIYPNPVKDEMRVDIPFEKDALIEVFDSNGRLVLTEKHYSTMSSIQIRQLPPGMYSVKIEGGFSKYSGKFLKE